MSFGEGSRYALEFRVCEGCWKPVNQTNLPIFLSNQTEFWLEENHKLKSN